MPLVLSGTNGISGVDGTASNPSYEGTDSNTGIFYPAADTVAIGTGGTEALRVNSSQQVGVNTSSPTAPLDVVSNSAATSIKARGRSSDNIGVQLFTANNGSTNYGSILWKSDEVRFVNENAGYLSFYTSATERARITSGGTFLVAKTTDDFTTAGIILRLNGTAAITCSSNENLDINRLTTDGKLVRFFQDSIEEGNISVSGTTVSYNGGHLARWSQLLNGQRDESIVKGTVLSNLDEMCEWTDAEGNPLPNEQLNRMKVSDVEGDTNVAGVFVNWDNDDNNNPYDMNIAMTGDMIIRIAQGVTVQKGDLLMSAGDGTAKPQGDDIVRSKTVAKVTSNHVICTYDDGSYCVPCVLMAC